MGIDAEFLQNNTLLVVVILAIIGFTSVVGVFLISISYKKVLNSKNAKINFGVGVTLTIISYSAILILGQLSKI